MGLSLEWSYFERTITRTITGLAGDGRRGAATKGETLGRWGLTSQVGGNMSFRAGQMGSQLLSLVLGSPWGHCLLDR